jgi:hypothetical protein
VDPNIDTAQSKVILDSLLGDCWIEERKIDLIIFQAPLKEVFGGYFSNMLLAS